MLDLNWVEDMHLISRQENIISCTSLDNISLDGAVDIVRWINKTDKKFIADKIASLARYSRSGLTITPTYLSFRGSNRASRRRVHPFGLIQYITASLLISGNSFDDSGQFIECAKARNADVLYGSLCFYINELNNLRDVLPMDSNDVLNISKIFSGKTLHDLPEINMATDIPVFEKLRSVYINECVRPTYHDDVAAYTAFWEMMYDRTFAGCFQRYMPLVLNTAIKRI